jgi:MFS family permease
MQSFKGNSSERTWLFSILKNKIADHYRKASTRYEVSDNTLSSGDESRSFLDLFFDSDGEWSKNTKPKKWSTDSILIASALIGVAGSFLTVFGVDILIATIGCFLFAFWNGSMIGLIVARLREVVGQQATRKAWAIFSFLLSIGYILYTFASSYLYKYSIAIILWVGFALTAAQLLTMLIAAMEFKKQSDHPFA